MSEQSPRPATAEAAPADDRDDLGDVEKKLLQEFTPKMIKGLLTAELSAGAKKFSIKELLTIIRMAERLAADIKLKERVDDINKCRKLAAEKLSAIMSDEKRSALVAMHVEEFSTPELKIIIELAKRLEAADLDETVRGQVEACRLLADTELGKQKGEIRLKDEDLIMDKPEGSAGDPGPKITKEFPTS